MIEHTSVHSLRYMDNSNDLIKNLSKYLFWDTNTADINAEKHCKYIITRVLQLGKLDDWQKILKYYGINKIIECTVKSREIDKKTASFLSAISDVPKKRFLCYNTKQSIPKHWNF